MHTRLTPVLAVATVGLLAFTASGCSSAGADDGNAGATLTYWATNNGSSVEDDQATLQAEADKFTEGSGVKVDVEVIPWANLLDRILTAVTTGEGPDVVNFGNTWTASLQATGAFLPFDDAVFDTLGGVARYAAPALSANGAEGETPISVPLYNFVNGLYYNKALLAEAGIDAPPATWAEFVADSKALTKDTDGDGAIDQWGASFEPNSLNVWPYANQLNSDVLSGDEPDLTDASLNTAVADFAGWYGTDGIVNPADIQITSFTQVVQNLVDGKAGFILQQTGEQTFTNLGLSDDDYGVVPLPVFDPLPSGGEPVTAAIGGTNVGIFANTENRDAAVDFVAFLSSTEESSILSAAFGATSPVIDAQSAEAFQTPVAKQLAEILNTSAKGQPQIASATQLETALNDAITSVWTKAATNGSVSADEVTAALEAAQQTYDASK